MIIRRSSLIVVALALLSLTSLSDAFSLIDFRGVCFQVGMPTSASALEESLRLPADDELRILEQDVDTLLRNPYIRIRIYGFTDDQECVGETACQELSLRRATLVYGWLLMRGVLPTQVVDVEGMGDEPIDFNDYEEGRQRNRRIEIVNTQFDEPSTTSN
jgi:hypothetical protein